MKRLLVLSDSHGRATDLAAICALHPEADRIVFLGDGEEDIELLQLSFPELKLLAVRGNNDFYSSLPYEDVLVLGGARIFFTHASRSPHTSMLIGRRTRKISYTACESFSSSLWDLKNCRAI